MVVRIGDQWRSTESEDGCFRAHSHELVVTGTPTAFRLSVTTNVLWGTTIHNHDTAGVQQVYNQSTTSHYGKQTPFHTTALTRASTRWHSCGCLCAWYGRLVDEVDGKYTEPLVRTMLCIFCGVQYRWIDMERGCVDAFHGVAACAAVSSRRNWIGAQCKGGRLKCLCFSLMSHPKNWRMWSRWTGTVNGCWRRSL